MTIKNLLLILKKKVRLCITITIFSLNLKTIIYDPIYGNYLSIDISFQVCNNYGLFNMLEEDKFHFLFLNIFIILFV